MSWISVQESDYLKIESAVYNFMVVFDTEKFGTQYTFKSSSQLFPVVMEDDQGNLWDVFGSCVSGPDRGAKLKPVHATEAYWFAWINMFPSYVLDGNITYNSPIEAADPSWSVPADYIHRGAKFDAIPAIDEPRFDTLTFRNCLENYFFLDDMDEVLIVSTNGITKVYPLKILEQHEIVNDHFANQPVIISYAPYTGSASVYNRAYNENPYTFGVSGYVYMNNLLFFDRETQSYWSQMLSRAVSGPLRGGALEPVSFIRTTWGVWKNAADSYIILSEDQGFDKEYRAGLFEAYEADHTDIPFEVPVQDSTRRNKDLLFGLISEDQVLLFDSF